MARKEQNPNRFSRNPDTLDPDVKKFYMEYAAYGIYDISDARIAKTRLEMGGSLDLSAANLGTDTQTLHEIEQSHEKFEGNLTVMQLLLVFYLVCDNQEGFDNCLEFADRRLHNFTSF